LERRGQLFGDCSFYAAQLMGVRYSLPQYGRIKSHYLVLAKAKKNEQTGPFYRVAMRNQQWRGGLMCISGSFSPHGPDTLKALPRGALFLWQLRDEKPRIHAFRNGHMTSRDKKDAESTEKLGVNTARLEALAAEAAQAKHWRARKSGMQDQGEPSEVRNLNHDAEARAQAEAAMQRMMEKSGGKRRGR
jgi:hypothetical protein